VSSKGRLWAGRVLRIVVSGALMAWLFSRFETTKILATLGGISGLVWFSCVLLHLAAQMLSSLRWWMISQALGLPGTVSRFVAYYFVGIFFNLFLPTGMGGDLVKIHYLARGREALKAAFSVASDRFFGLVAMLLIGGVAVVFLPSMLPGHLSGLVVGLAAAAMSLFLGAPAIARVTGKLLPHVSSRLADLGLLWKRPRAVLMALALSLVLQGLGMAMVWVLGLGLGIPLPLPFYMAVLPLITLLTLLPVTFNGIGLREGALVFFMKNKGVSPELAFSLGLLVLSVHVALGLLGGAVYLSGAHKASPRRSP